MLQYIEAHTGSGVSVLGVKEWEENKLAKPKQNINLFNQNSSIYESVTPGYLSGFFDSQTNAGPKKKKRTWKTSCYYCTYLNHFALLYFRLN